MSENNSIWDNAKEAVGVFKFGVCWGRRPRERIGEYSDTAVYDNNGKVVAKFDGQLVSSPEGNVLGQIQGNEIIVEGKVVGTFIGTPSAGAAGLALLFCGLELPPYNNSLKGDAAKPRTLG